jgi:hypothetical protein
MPFIPPFFNLGQIGEGPVELAGKVTDSQEALDPAEQFDLVDRFGQEIVSPVLNASLEVGRLIERGDHQDLDILRFRVGPEFLADLEAGEPRHHDVEQEQVGMKFFNDSERILTVDGRPDLAVDLREIGFEELDVLEIVVGDQDFRVTLGQIQANASSGIGKRLRGCSFEEHNPSLTPILTAKAVRRNRNRDELRVHSRGVCPGILMVAGLAEVSGFDAFAGASSDA